MREIKFRAWDKDAGRMILASTIKMCPISSDGTNTLNYQARLLRYELMQYTGLKDKNGVEIYEGDIISVNDPKDYFEVVFQEGAFNIVSEKLQCVDNGYNMEFYKKEGNTYKNPELLS